MGQALINAATWRKNIESNSEGDSANDSDDECFTPTTTMENKQTRLSNNFHSDEMDRFELHMKEPNLARIALERHCLALEQERAVADRIELKNRRGERRLEGEAKHQKRRDERIKQQKLEVENLKVMIESFNPNK